MTIHQYIEQVSYRLKSGISREHSYRGDLESLIRDLVKGVEITNEPANVTDCGNPDYVITKGKIPVGYIEAKDIGKDLNGKQYREQFDRYKKALDNLIITDYIWFQFFQNGELVHEIHIGEIENNTVTPLPENFSNFENLIKSFCSHIGQTIKSSKRLAEMMASKARLLQNILESAINSDEETQENTSLIGQYKTFKNYLIHDLSTKAFADIYAQTLAHGMFAARLHDTTLDDFSRYEAAELIPKSNPFLRKLFGYIAGPDIDERILRTVDNLAEVFRATNVDQLLKNFGKSTQTQDPIIHFYETFLAEYDPKLRKARGVWYTPEPIVSFIVRAVNDILISEFNLPNGLADTSKTKVKVPVQGKKKLQQIEVHKVQILDPATGTGTFLAEVVKFIYNKRFSAMQGAWSGYVEEHLIPRLNGFEILMASYAMAHLKLEMLLRDTGYKETKNQRLNVYLTNSLEEHHPDTGNLFSNWLSSEANEANHIKRDTPVMCVLGNPPYSVSSTNKSRWILDILKDYKKDLKETKINLDDDYIKFIRYGQYYIDKNGEGVLAYISNNSFIDGVTHRQMRKHLLKSFDKVYILDLHGSSMKNETTNTAHKDENVFDIMQGVSINIFVKTGTKKKNELGKVLHYDLYGNRGVKYPFLLNKHLKNISWNKITNKEPYYFFVPKDFKLESVYQGGFSVKDLFGIYGSGVKNERDKICIHFSSEEIKSVVIDFFTLEEEDIRLKYHVKDTRDWKIKNAKKDIISNYGDHNYRYNLYRPFDKRHTYYTGTTRGFIGTPGKKRMFHLINKENISLLTARQQSTFNFQHVFISREISDICSLSSQTKETGYVFPLYVYPKNEFDEIFTKEDRHHNLTTEIIKQIATITGLTFTNEKENSEDTFAPIDILDYIYAVLHSPTYREKFKEFLKIDFPRIPYPRNSKSFWQLVKLGEEIREVHLLENPKVDNYITSYPIDGDNKIASKVGKNDWELTDIEKQVGRIWINSEQYFDCIPLSAWEFYIGGYQPAQKWLKDRKGRSLTFDDIIHYQRIIVALAETVRLMKEVDKIDIE